MNRGTMLRSRMLGIACVMVFASSMALAQTAGDANSASPGSAPSDAAPSKAKHSKKTQEGNASSESTQKRGRYGTEAEAKARCRGEVVWVDKDNFNHYKGSREYGRQPGSFACENG